jgi:hypothetical protein
MALAPRSPAYRMADRLCGGDLAARLAKCRADGLSWDDVSRRLYAESGVEASRDTIRSWARQLGIEPPAPKSVALGTRAS